MRYSPNATLTETQHQVLDLLAHGASITTAAQSAGIHRNTVANWRRTDPAFAKEFEFASRESALFWHDQATALAPKALEVLNGILHDETASKSLRLRAALKVLDLAADPQPEPMKPFPASAAELEAVDGRVMLLQAQMLDQAETPAQSAQPAQSSTVETVRRAPEPGRNSPCPCQSGLKFKRCCANKPAQSAQSAQAAA